MCSPLTHHAKCLYGNSAIIWLKYCRYSEINHIINQYMIIVRTMLPKIVNRSRNVYREHVLNSLFSYIVGLCAEYDIIGNVIQPNYHANCSKFKADPCPGVYFSNEAFKCKFMQNKIQNIIILWTHTGSLNNYSSSYCNSCF